MLFVSMGPEMCKFCNEIVLDGVSGSFPKLILAWVLKFCFDFKLKFVSFTDSWDTCHLINVSLSFFLLFLFLEKLY